jgi:hypothetical protein
MTPKEFFEFRISIYDSFEYGDRKWHIFKSKLFKKLNLKEPDNSDDWDNLILTPYFDYIIKEFLRFKLENA